MPRSRALAVLFAALGLISAAAGQCVPEWSVLDLPSFGPLAVWDRDGFGPERPVLVGAQGLPSLPNRRARIQVGWYDGRAWRPLGTPFIGRSSSVGFGSLVVANTSGVGSPAPGLYMGGTFIETTFEPTNNIARWDGERWRMVGGGVGGYGFTAQTRSLCMFDEDGSGPSEANLFVGGYYYEVSLFNMPGLVRWDGSTYSEVGGGLVGYRAGLPIVTTMIVFDDDGPGPRRPALYVGGSFPFAGGMTVNNIAKWDGDNWQALGDGLSVSIYNKVNALAVFDADGDGPEPAMLYAGGEFYLRDPAGNRLNTLARWNGSDWVAVPGWNTGIVRSLAVFDDDGDGPNKPALFVGARMFSSTNAVPTNGIAKWDGQRWYDLGSGLSHQLVRGTAMGMQSFDEDDDPSTPAGLYVTGYHDFAGGTFTRALVRWGCPSPICFADCDESTGLGTLDLFDFLCFQNLFVANDPYACDCDTTTGPLVCDLLDFLCFQEVFVGGCP